MTVTLIVQTDDGRLGNANAYIDLPTFKSYHDNRGNDYSAFSDVKLSQAIILASDYVDTRFKYIGLKRHDQILISTLTSTGAFNDGETVTVGPKVYTLQAALTNVDGHVKIAATPAQTILNLRNAINLDGINGVPGTDFALATTASSFSIVANADATHLSVAADPSSQTTPIPSLDTCANANFDSAFLSVSNQTTEWPRIAGWAGTITWFDFSFLDPTVGFISGLSAVSTNDATSCNLVGPNGSPIIGIPPQIKRASCEYSFRALSQPLFRDAPAPLGGRLIDEQTNKVDTIEQTTKWAPGQSGAFVMPAYPPADLLLVRAGLIIAGRQLIR